MKDSDRVLGMHRDITRRDILHGMGAISAGALLPRSLFAEQWQATQGGDSYPPALTGMRGNHAGAFEVAHRLARQGQTDWGTVLEPDSGAYDLVVVGAGISGLSAAHFYRKENPKARMLILDNHDDFGGHAKRNEFQIGDLTLITHGGSETLTEPSGFSDVVKGLLSDLNVEPKRFESAYDQDFYKRNNLRGGLHFDKASWGVNRTVPLPLAIPWKTLSRRGLIIQNWIRRVHWPDCD
jgi:spermidine dehydrogenase